MPKRCGDLAHFHFRVRDEAVGKLAVTHVVRDGDKHLAASSMETLAQKERKEIRWPDLQKPASTEWIGGRKADFVGLDKRAYAKKFDAQKFGLELYVAGKAAKSSAGLKINGYPDVARDPKQIGIPMAVEMWKDVVVGAATVRQRTFHDPAGTAYVAAQHNCGHFHLEVKDGVLVVTIKLELFSSKKLWSKARVFAAIKKAAEGFWNASPNGFRQWTWHRKACARKERCPCKLVLDGKARYTQAGCCKVPVRVNLEQGADNRVEIQFLSSAQKKQKKAQGYVSGLRADTQHLWYPENHANTFAHEIGHMMGFPDQYWCGVIATGAVHATGPTAGYPDPAFAPWPIDDDSIMGQNTNRAKEIHFAPDWFKDWVKAKVEDVDVLRR